MFLIDTVILTTGILLLLGIASSKLSARLGVPVLALFLLLGMLAGSEGIGGIEFEDYRLTHAIGTLALALILLDGGLSTSLSSIRLAWKPSFALATLGVFVTAAVTGLAASWILQISLLEGLLLGSIVGSTDASAVFSVLRTGGISLPKRISAVLEVESASNDPMAIFLTIGCIEVLLGNVGLGPGLISLFASQMVIGSICGLLGGYAAGLTVNRIELAAPGMYPVLISSFGLLTYGAAANLGGSGFLAVYMAGVIIGNRPLVFKRGIRQFHDAIAWLSQIVMFVVLGLLCFPSRLLEVAGKAILISLVLVLIARPLSVLVSIFPFKFNWKEISFISWVGLKGAVPITLATFPLMLGTIEQPLQASLLFDVVFFIVVVSALIQGSSIARVARWLGLEQPREPEAPLTLEISSLRHVDGEVVDYSIGEFSRAAGRRVKDLALPDGAVIAIVSRGDQIVPPQGNTYIQPGDHVILVVRSGIQPLVNQVFASRPDQRGEIPALLEFPLRGSTPVNTLRELYDLEIQPSDSSSLADAMRHHLANQQPSVGDTICLGQMSFRVLRLSSDGAIEMIGMSLRPIDEIAAATSRAEN